MNNPIGISLIDLTMKFIKIEIFQRNYMIRLRNILIGHT